MHQNTRHITMAEVNNANIHSWKEYRQQFGKTPPSEAAQAMVDKREAKQQAAA